MSHPTSNLEPGLLFGITRGARSLSYILKVLALSNNQASGEKGAAKILGMKPTTLESRMKKLGIKRRG